MSTAEPHRAGHIVYPYLRSWRANYPEDFAEGRRGKGDIDNGERNLVESEKKRLGQKSNGLTTVWKIVLQFFFSPFRFRLVEIRTSTFRPTSERLNFV